MTDTEKLVDLLSKANRMPQNVRVLIVCAMAFGANFNELEKYIIKYI